MPAQWPHHLSDNWDYFGDLLVEPALVNPLGGFACWKLRRANYPDAKGESESVVQFAVSQTAITHPPSYFFRPKSDASSTMPEPEVRDVLRENIRPYAFRIAGNRINTIFSNKWPDRPETDLPREDEEDGPSERAARETGREPPPDSSWLRREYEEALEACLDELSAENRRILELYYRDGKSLNEIAPEVGLAHETVNQRRHRAQRTLYQCLNDKGFEDLPDDLF